MFLRNISVLYQFIYPNYMCILYRYLSFFISLCKWYLKSHCRFPVVFSLWFSIDSIKMKRMKPAISKKNIYDILPYWTFGSCRWFALRSPLYHQNSYLMLSFNVRYPSFFLLVSQPTNTKHRTHQHHTRHNLKVSL